MRLCAAARQRKGLSRRAWQRRTVAADARGAPQPGCRARHVRRPRRRAGRAGEEDRCWRAHRQRARRGRQRQDAVRPPLRLELAGRLAGRRRLLRPERGARPRRHSERGRGGARSAVVGGGCEPAARPRDRRARTLPDRARQLRAGARARRRDARRVGRARRRRRVRRHHTRAAPPAGGGSLPARAAAARGRRDRPLRRARPRADAGLRARRRQPRGRGAHRRAARRTAAGDRAGRGAGARACAGADRRTAARPLRAPGRRARRR